MLSTWNAYIPVASGHAGRSPIRARYLAGGPPAHVGIPIFDIHDGELRRSSIYLFCAGKLNVGPSGSLPHPKQASMGVKMAPRRTVKNIRQASLYVQGASGLAPSSE
jgi:hypothetical protein